MPFILKSLVEGVLVCVCGMRVFLNVLVCVASDHGAGIASDNGNEIGRE